ncbi:hypothetical protein M9H77_33521 [Catharanthus roseus]|uniref:Uncharacterized protein n=1 Tax=Catharanthus roseus TaxID=4058 RepID=A0ACB9ZL19_CATRO|nr:hypothetical protein M9H77_33521 [Catharanthus roseus]
MDIIRGRVVDPVKAYFGKYRWSLENLESMDDYGDVPPFVMNHLKHVYFCLAFVLSSSAVGSVLHFFRRIGGLTTVLGFVVCLKLFSSTPPQNEWKRIYLLIAAALFKGASVDFLLRPFINVEGFIITVLVGSSLAFVCFAGAARNCERQRGHTYSFGVLDTLIACTYWLFAAVKIFDGEYPYTVLVMLTLQGDCYFSGHCIMFFTDMPAIFYHQSSPKLKLISRIIDILPVPGAE